MPYVIPTIYVTFTKERNGVTMPEAGLAYYSISDASERLNLSHRTLHYYEEKLSLQINRTTSGERIYSEEDINLFEIIKDLKNKGMRLDGIRSFLIEKNLIRINQNNEIIQLDEFEYQRSVFREDFKYVLSEQLTNINSKLDRVLDENQLFKDQIDILMRQTDEHYKKLDGYLTSWRNNKKTPWFKKIFK